MEDSAKNQLLRQLPSVAELLAEPTARALSVRHGPAVLARAARRTVAAARERLLTGGAVAPASGPGVPALASALGAEFVEAVAAELVPGLRRVINASGVVLHTNLGRAPLAAPAIEAMRQVTEGYSNLELDLATGERGSRHAALAGLLCELTCAEAALVVNNCAGAVLLTLAALGQGHGAVVSRGELLEIGGGFRIPDVMAQSGVSLREVGTTNKTRLADYATAIAPDTALLVKVHRANFAQLGFTEDVSARELAALAHGRQLTFYEDLGSGSLTPALGERTVQAAVADGADVVTFSGDKLLGGPQAGLVVGKAALVAKLAAHPLLRALRIDKATAAALEATLRLYRDGRQAEIPALQILLEAEATVAERAATLHAALVAAGVACRVVPALARVGGGSLPLRELPSRAVVLAGGAVLAAALRQPRGPETPVVARLADGQLWLDVRAVHPSQLDELACAVLAAVRGQGRAVVALHAGAGDAHA